MAQLISIDDSDYRKPLNPNDFALFELASRPFFLLGNLFALLAIIPWVLTLHGTLTLPHLSTWWHAHEMIFGFALAIILGFLLTAAQTWMWRAEVRGQRLALLVALWAVAAYWSGLFAQCAFGRLGDIRFLCHLGVCVLARMIIQVKQWRNAPFLALLLLFALLSFRRQVIGRMVTHRPADKSHGSVGFITPA